MWRDSTTRSTKRFSYLLLDEGEFYIQDWIATCKQGSLDVHAKTSLLPWQQRQIKGRLRLCSKSIFFEPDNLSVPIIRFPLTRIKNLDLSTKASSTTSFVNAKSLDMQNGFILEASLHVKMKENGIDAPYVFEKKDSIWWFALEFAPVQQFLKQAQSLISKNNLPSVERDMVLYNSRAQQEAQAQFDSTRLVDLSEKIYLDVPSAQVTPLVREPGRLVITQARLYFQPLFNLNNDTPVRCQPLGSIIAIARRRHALRQIGLEIFFKEEDNNFKSTTSLALVYGASAFFTFQNVEERERVANMLLSKLKGHAMSQEYVGCLLEADAFLISAITKAWQEHRISNYDYLIYLNLAAGRSFCDLAQWPVMPWILKDYKSKTLDLTDSNVFRDLSKPIGALNPERLAIFKDRYQQMLDGGTSDPPFLYGTHYSTPGYVLYWLVRAAPAHMLRLQNGRFDAPDRLFVSMEESWEHVLNNAADLKELTPEFFSLPSDFLRIRDTLKLGIRQRGDPVGDVKLPPWATDADDFIIKHRKALECEHVSQHLNEWIDLIFGYKQRGKNALDADNLFHPLSYEGTVDLEKIDDPIKRAGLEVQIHEFGQVPQQLFHDPHPSRFPCQIDVGDVPSLLMRIDLGGLIHRLIQVPFSTEMSFANGDIKPTENVKRNDPDMEYRGNGVSDVPDKCQSSDVEGSEETDHEWYSRFRESFSDPQSIKMHRGAVSGVAISEENASECLTLFSVSKDGFIKVHSISDGLQLRSTRLGTLPLSSLALAESQDAYPIVLAGSYDNCVYAYSVDYGRAIGKVRVHDDTVSCMCVMESSSQQMITASWDATIKIWDINDNRGFWTMNSGAVKAASQATIEFLEHDGPVQCLDAGKQNNILTSGSEDGSIIAWDPRSGTSIWSQLDKNKGSPIGLRFTPDDKHVLVGFENGNISLIDVGKGVTLGNYKFEDPINCCEIADPVILAGSTSGLLYVLPFDMVCIGGQAKGKYSLSQHHNVAVNSLSVSSATSRTMQYIATGHEDGVVQIYSVTAQ